MTATEEEIVRILVKEFKMEGVEDSTVIRRTMSNEVIHSRFKKAAKSIIKLNSGDTK